MTVHDGPDGEVFLPALYFGSVTSGDHSLQTGRSTDWIDDGGPIRGVGQRMYLVGEEDRPILDIKSIEFERA
jgi:type VI secretion system protein ImpE